MSPRKGKKSPVSIYDKHGNLTNEAMLQMYQQTLSPMRLVDKDFTIIAQNPAMERLARYPTAQAVGRKCYEVARSPEFCHTDRCPNVQIMAGQSRVEQSYKCELWDGTIFPAWVLATPYYDAARNIVGSLQTVRDESHLTGIAEALEKKNREISRHLAQMQGYNEIIQLLNREKRMEDMAAGTLRLLPRFTPMIMGVLYRFDESGDRLLPIASHAVAGPVPEFMLGQGLPGEVALHEQAIYLDDVPESYFAIRSGVGGTLPKHIACLPILAGERFIGVLELAAFQSFSEDRLFLDDVTLQLGIAMQNAIMIRKTEELAAELQAQNEKLESQNEELRAQSEELIAQSEEIQSQAEELTAQRDALERKTLEADEANRMKSIFLSNMSHELRTPLNAILGLSRLMVDGVAGSVNSQQGQYLEVILRNGNNLMELINDILDLSRVETGREDVRFDTIHLRGFLESLAGSIRSLAERQRLRFSLEIAPEVSTLVSDERKLGQVLTNLLGNAIKFTEKGTVTLRVSVKEVAGRNQIHFAIEDTGIGIAPENLEIIFEPFRQIDGSVSRKYGGSGLGLSICKKLVAILGGDLQVESKLGQGSRFTVILPGDRRGNNRLADREWQERLQKMLTPDSRLLTSRVSFPAPEAEPRPETETCEAEDKAERPHILLVEDDMISVRELGVQLREAGYQVSFSLDGKTGLRLLEKLRPDLVILDLIMPVMDGYGFLREMRRMPDLARIPVIILSAMDVEPETARRLPANVQGVLAKGNILRDQLLNRVRHILGRPAPGGKAGGPPASPAPEVISAIGRPRPGGRRILIAEDNSDNMFFLEEILKTNDYEIMRAENGKEAVRIAAGQPPDLILMDIQMPDMSGLEAIQALRGLDLLKDIPIVAITARAMKGDRRKMLESGCDDYVSKPVDPEILLKKIRKWLGRGEAHEQDTDRR